jgi:peroxiredoxin
MTGSLQEVLSGTFVHCIEMDGSLEERLSTYAKAVRRASPSFAGSVDALIARLKEHDVGASAPKPGEPMPPFCLPDETGRLVTLESLLEDGPAAVIFHRGHWCPYCRINTHALARAQQDVADAGGQIVAIMPDRRKFAVALHAEAGARFPILTDLDNGYALSINLVFWVGAEMEQLISEAGWNVPDFQGNASWLLPIPATFVLDRAGIVRARFVDPDYRKRMAIRDLLAAMTSAR